MEKNGKILLSVKEAADLLGVSRDMLYEWVSRRKIPFIKFGRLVKFTEEDLNKFIRTCRVEPTEVKR